MQHPIKQRTHGTVGALALDVNGIIAIDAQGNIELEFNPDRMHRGYRVDNEIYVATYPEEK